MYIKSMVIDGFKSYAQRTEIYGFDQLFNAITGLNGSGKSNILDSICFLLGITNLSHVRATNLQELVYKNGQAGITKATVSITFDNLDKKQSPLGYEQYDEITITRQVVVGGRNKYLINGSNANNTRVQDLFRSVQLNVNNPHFLIMQGRITKVLNMKPPEILSMIEEAAGTRLYESKKEAAQRTIEKKDMKLKEIDTVLKEDITPTITKLKEERSSYLEFQKINRELEHLNKLYIAYQFLCAEEKKKKSAEELTQMQEGMKKLQDRMVEIDEKVKELDTVISELERKRDEESGSVMKKLEDTLSENKKLEALAQSAVDDKKDGLKAENKRKKELTKNSNDNTSAIKGREKDLEKIAKELESLQKQSEADQDAHVAAQKHYQAVSAGLSSNDDGQAATLNDQLITAKSEISNAETEAKQAAMKLKHAQQELKKKESDLKKTEQGYKKDKQAYDNVAQNLNKLEAELKKLNYEEGKDEMLETQRRTLSQEVNRLQDKMETLEARFPHLHFDYKNPEKNFDRSKVSGLVCKLIKVKDVKTATALEVAAGGKLYNVVVDTEQTGKQLLQKGELRRRYTIIPLNKISSRYIPNDVVKQAEGLVGKDNVHTALSLIGFDNNLKAAMEFVFGSTFVCTDMNVAKKVTFDDRIQKRSVTLGGDSFDPAGTLTGGARAQTSSILEKLQEFTEVEQQLRQKQDQLAKVEQELHNIRGVAQRFTKLKQEYDLKQQEVEHLKEKLEQGSHHQQLEEINTLKENIVDYEETAKRTEEIKKKNSTKVKDLENKIKNAKQIREKELKDAEQAVTKAKKKTEESSKIMKQKSQEVDSIKLEVEELKKEITSYDEQLATVEETIKQYQSQLEELDGKASEAKEVVKAAQEEVNKQKALLKACDKDIGAKVSEQKTLQKEHHNSEIKIKELDNKIVKFQKDTKDASKLVEHMLETYEWIVDERKQFNQPNTAYDFKVNDPKESERRIQKLTETKEKLARNVNMRAMNMLGKAEEQYQDLMKKRKIVLNDKAKISAVILELDEKKNEALKKAWEQVNKDFGSIYSTLLPGARAKLAPPEGQSVLDGLEVKVGFGDVWKDSLSELSGGQRSLIALSLILAMLLFKPAPIYILDEVDAALDISHTQNIGQMIKSHFKHSQFIVVSLKDGMFNNANVLFKTKFVDGVSTVTRYVQHANKSNDGKENNTAANAKKKQAGANKRARLEEVA
ncbi:LOW QUALITY PROTEIN: structural maintenance of chromosomes protein 2-like [Ruditapes philippinarum]|uniref:LOW QUALITY PROTEIN: structural maintenance of chromosomes protein 2-like n=1 Tax=Ruditapes philippinarum TaxID=129788 RepID=UPI00295ACA37|nr:LOW QUALITY PROTEIN: structural maintenance of chromosomes protein 2-like [Ruditapes philippinarum]